MSTEFEHYLTIGEATKLVKASRSKILRRIKDGTLSSKTAPNDSRKTKLIDPAELFRVFEKIPDGDNASTVDIELADQQPGSPQNEELVKIIVQENKELKNDNANLRLEIKQQSESLEELREINRSLPHPDDVSKRIDNAKKEEREKAEKRIEEEKTAAAKKLANLKTQNEQQEERWQEEIRTRKEEIENAKREADEINQRLEEERKLREYQSQEISALENRSVWARLMNKKPKIETAG